MARIDKAEHPRILQMVDVEHRKVADVAAEYGCTAANIYALLAKLRRGGAAPVVEAAPVQPTPPSPTPAVPDLFAAIPRPAEPAVPPPRVDPPPKPVVAEAPPRGGVKERAVLAKPAKPPVPSPPADPPSKPVVAETPPRGGVKGRAALAKPGFGLVMRTAEGEEGLTPFRSLEDLLSAVKPLLRAAARSPEPVWFSIQTIDLAALDSDAA